MKPKLITPIFLALALPLFSQNWLAEGQTWEYDMDGGWLPWLYGKHVLQVEGDEVVEGITCKRLVQYQPDGTTEEYFAYHEQGRVYVLNPYWDNFQKVYDFNLEPGDTVFFYGDRKYVIELVGFGPVAGADRKYQIIHLLGDLDQGTYVIAEGIGLMAKIGSPWPPEYDCNFFFMNHSFCDAGLDGRSYRFRCFTEGDITYDPFGMCTLSSVEGLHSQKLNIFPNPAQSQFTLQFEGNPNEYGLLRVFDATGRMMLEAPKTLPATVSTEGWPAGSYQVLFFGEKVTVRGRVVIP
ncbi:MAG: T9SS type A sorting domain-containing protein [Saprospiraceae bacterium]